MERGASLPSVLDGLGEPVGDSSVLPTALLAALLRASMRDGGARRGDGGDELFAGYDPFTRAVPRRAVRPADADGWCMTR